MDNVEAKVQELYKLAKQHPDDVNLQTAVNALKSVRRSRGALQGYNRRYREEVKHLNHEITLKDEEKTTLERELNSIKLDVQEMVVQKQRLIVERDRTKAELKHIQTEVELAAARVKETHGWFGKFSILWSFINSVFFDEPHEIGSIETSVKPDPDKPQMGSDPASIGKSLLDK